MCVFKHLLKRERGIVLKIRTTVIKVIPELDLKDDRIPLRWGEPLRRAPHRGALQAQHTVIPAWLATTGLPL